MNQDTDTPTTTPRAAAATVLAAAVVTVAVTGLMCTGALVIGVDQEWTWDLKPTQRAWALDITALAFAIYLASVVAIAHKIGSPDRVQRPRPGEDALLLFVLVVEGFALQLAAGQLAKAGLRDWPFIVALPRTNGYFDEALRVRDVRVFLRDYHRLMPELNFHCRTHPPGAILFFLTANRLFEACPGLTQFMHGLLADSAFDPGVLLDSLAQRHDLVLTEPQLIGAWASSMAIAGLCVLGCVPVFLIARRLFGRPAAFWAAAIYLASPYVLYFTPAVDQGLAAVCAYGGWLWMRGVGDADAGRGRRGALASAVLSGLVLAVALFVSLAAAPCGAMLFLWWARRLQLAWPRWRPFAAAAAAGTAGFVAFYVVLWAVSGHNCLATFATILEVGRENVRQGYIGRDVRFTYPLWLFWNLVEFSLCVGWAAVVCLVAGCWGRGWRAPLLLAFAITLLLLDVSAVSMSETGRLWMPLAWPATIFAAGYVSRAGHRAPALGAAVVALLFGQAVALRMFFGWA